MTSSTRTLSFIILPLCSFFFFFFNDTSTTDLYTLSLHDALPIFPPTRNRPVISRQPTSMDQRIPAASELTAWLEINNRSEEHTSELQSRQYLVCRLLLEKKKKK